MLSRLLKNVTKRMLKHRLHPKRKNKNAVQEPLKLPHGSEDAFCKLCHATITPKASNLTKHEKSDKYMQRVKLSTTMKPIQFVRALRVSDEVTIAEIELAVTMDCHSAILTIDHLGEVISHNATGSKHA